MTADESVTVEECNWCPLRYSNSSNQEGGLTACTNTYCVLQGWKRYKEPLLDNYWLIYVGSHYTRNYCCILYPVNLKPYQICRHTVYDMQQHMILVWMYDQGQSIRRGFKLQRVSSHTICHCQWPLDPLNVWPRLLPWTQTDTIDNMTCPIKLPNKQDDEHIFALISPPRVCSDAEMC